MQSNAELTVDGRAIDSNALAEICSRFGIAELAVFGSVARGEQTSNSDIDLLYVPSTTAKLGFTINQLEDELSQLFGRQADLVSKAGLHRLIKEQVTREAQALYAA